MSVLDRFRVDGRRALVTGGNRGLGRVFASALAEAGAEVAVLSTRAEEAERAAAEIAEATGRRTAGVGADVSREEDVARMAATIPTSMPDVMPVSITGNISSIAPNGTDRATAAGSATTPPMSIPSTIASTGGQVSPTSDAIASPTSAPTPALLSRSPNRK